MKQKIIELGRRWGLELKVEITRHDWDIYGYEVYHNDYFFGAYMYWTGLTSTGVRYPKVIPLEDINRDLSKYVDKK